MKLSKKGKELKEQRIQELRQKLQEVHLEKSSLGSKGFCEGVIDDASQIYSLESERMLMHLIAREQEELIQAEMIDESTLSEEVVNYGDKINALMAFPEEEPFEMTFELTDSMLSISDDLEKKISIESPIGAAVYGKMVGETITAVTPNGLLTIQILDKTRGIGR